MTIDQGVLAFAGFMVLVSLALATFVHPYFIALTVLVGLNAIQSAFTGFCPAAIVLKRLGFKAGAAFP